MKLRVAGALLVAGRLVLTLSVLCAVPGAAVAQSPPLLVKDILPGPGSSFPELLATAGGKAFFRTYGIADGRGPWVTDGTTAGTKLVENMIVEIGVTGPVAIGDRVVYAGRKAGVVGLWVADSTTATQLPGPLNPRFFTVLTGSTVIFAADCGAGIPTDPYRGCLWRTDGTAAGTALLKDIWSGATGTASTVNFLALGVGAVYFAGDDGLTGPEVWKTDGTPGGTVLVKELRAGTLGSSPSSFVGVGGTVFFKADDGVTGRELWRTDGTPGGTVLIKDIRPGAIGSQPLSFAALGGSLFFYADDGTHGAELWKSNGTDAGTVMVKDIYPGATPSNPYGLVTVGSVIFFGAVDPVVGIELWRTDGTTGGTYVVKDINPGPGYSGPLAFTTAHGVTYFQANDGVTGLEVWRTDGTAAGTRLVADLQPGAAGSEPGNFETLGRTLLFSASDGVTGTELWKISGGPEIGALPPALTVGAPNTIPGVGFTAGSVVMLFVATASGAVPYGPFTPSAWSPTALTLDIPPTVPLGNGFATVRVVNTDEGYAESNIAGALLYGDAADNIPTILTVRGTGLAPASIAIGVAHADTVSGRGETITITGTGFSNPLVNLFTAAGNIGPLAPTGPWTATGFQVTVPGTAPAGPGNFQVVNGPYTGNVASNAVATVLVSQPAITSVNVTGPTVTVTGAGFSTLSVINLYNAQGGGVVNLGGLLGTGAPQIPLTVTSENQFSFTVPPGAVAGAAYVQVLNPPFNPFGTSDDDPDGAFTIPSGAPALTAPPAAPVWLADGAAPTRETSGFADDAAPASRPVTWTAAVGVETGPGLVRRGRDGEAWRAGARSVEALVGPGRLQWVVGPEAGDVVAGLSEGDRGPSPRDLTYALRVRRGTGDLAVVERGRRVAGVGPVEAGDRLSIVVRDGAVDYFRNGDLLWTSERASVAPLVADVSFGAGLASLADAALEGRVAAAVAWLPRAGTTVQGMRVTALVRTAVAADGDPARAVEARLDGAAGIGLGAAACDYCILQAAAGLQVRHAGEVRGTWPEPAGQRVRVELGEDGVVRYFAGARRLDEAPAGGGVPAGVRGWIGGAGAAIADATAEAPVR
jgi:ELWxxDGT repeat protein